MVNLSPRSGCCNNGFRIAMLSHRRHRRHRAAEQKEKRGFLGNIISSPSLCLRWLTLIRNPEPLLPTPHSRSEDHPPLIEIAPDYDRFVGLNFAAEEFHRQRVLDHVLNGAFQRARAVDRVEALARQKLFSRLVERESDLALFEHAAQRFELNLDDPAQLLDPEALEDDH